MSFTMKATAVILFVTCAPFFVQSANAPYQALLELSHAHMPGIWRCGGALIDKQYVLTAASCAKSAEIGDVLLGTVKVHSEPALFKKVERIIIHPDYFNHQNDIALIRLGESPIPENTPGVEIIRLDNTTDVKGSNGTLSGWPHLSSSLLISPTTVESCNHNSDLCADANTSLTAGSALVINNALAGISKAPGAEEFNGTITFTKVSDYLVWIASHILK